MAATITGISQVDSLIQQGVNGLPQFISALDNNLQAQYDKTIYGDVTAIDGGGAFVSKNPNYQIQLVKNTTPNIAVIGNTPTDFEFSFNNEYVSLFDTLGDVIKSGGKEGWFGTGVDLLVGAGLGFGLNTIASSLQIWKGTSPLDFTIPITFRAYSDPVTEVINPVRALIQMGSPARLQLGGAGTALGAIRSPGPSMGDILASAVTGGGSGWDLVKNGGFGTNFLKSLRNGITLFYGQKIVIPGLVITSLHVKFLNRAHRGTGLPVACDVSIGLKTIYAYAQDEMLAMFYGTNFKGATASTQTSSAVTRGTGG
jgi:hypothetical protein